VELERWLNLAGVRIPGQIRNRLGKAGVYARPAVSLEHQGFARRYVVRGVESGGATEDMGHYVTYADENGEPLCRLQTVDSLRPNGAHAVVIAPALVRVELFRYRSTCDLCISMHRPVEEQSGRRPKLHAERLFVGMQGHLGFTEATGRDDQTSLPRLFTRSGEALAIPEKFRSAVAGAVSGATCIGCSHAHYSRPSAESCATQPRESETVVEVSL